MEALSFFKFWKPATSTTTVATKPTKISTENSYPKISVDSESDFDQENDEEEDSFFELELSVSDFDKKNRVNTKDEQSRLKAPEPTTGDVFSRRKILPIEPSSKPQSPVPLLKSAPKLRVSIFKKPKTMVAESKTESVVKQGKQENDRLTVKFTVEEPQNGSVFTKSRSLRKSHELIGSLLSSSSDNGNMSKRFSKETIQKYLNRIKPLYVKASKKNEKMRFGCETMSEASPASSPMMGPMQSPRKEKQGSKSGFRAASKHLGKSKSTTSATISSPARRDDSLLLQHDGIQSAILHCKRSFNSSRADSSLLSRSTSGSSHDTLSNISSTDSSLLSRFSSDSSSAESFSARRSIEDRNGF